MPTRNVVLTAHQSSLVEELVSTGRYQNASEVLREGLRLVEQRERRDAAKLAALRSAVGEGRADLAAGRYVEVDDAALDDYFAELGARAASRRPA
ncbi:MAG: type II toxin-antitoxin system ParD family antitoxin [Micropruina sp.]|uniref:type II toxin-antitoxin system ParD family antitoxin n=1 Tax=Micropruina sp. TaxID=2737536 RepID=UPI0039E4AE28